MCRVHANSRLQGLFNNLQAAGGFLNAGSRASILSKIVERAYKDMALRSTSWSIREAKMIPILSKLLSFIFNCTYKRYRPVIGVTKMFKLLYPINSFWCSLQNFLSSKLLCDTIKLFFLLRSVINICSVCNLPWVLFLTLVNGSTEGLHPHTETCKRQGCD